MGGGKGGTDSINRWPISLFKIWDPNARSVIEILFSGGGGRKRGHDYA